MINLKWKTAVSKSNEKGQALVLAVVVVALVLINTLIIIGSSQTFFLNSRYTVQADQALNLAEAGLDKAVASLNATGGKYKGEIETPLGSGSYGVTVTIKDASTLIIQSTGYIPNKSNPQVKRTIQTQTTLGSGISFVYGMLVGEGGLSMGNGSIINGSIYSNGNVVGGTNESITGDMYVAGGTQPSADQSSDCEGSSCTDFIFGKNIAGESRQYVAQLFRPSAAAVLNKVSLKLKKIGSPANLIVRIMADNGGAPDKNNVLTWGTLSADLVSSEPGFVEVFFSQTPPLIADTPYWVMVSAQALDNSNYWIWSEDNLQGYTGGFPAWSSDWQAKPPVWQSVVGDLGFQTWMGGIPTYVSMGNLSTIQGNVHANTINGVTINKDAYYQVITNSTVAGVSHPNSTDPPPVPMPISQSNIDQWQEDARSYGVTNGDLTGCPSRLGPGKIIGNVITSSNCQITVFTPIQITGNLTFGNSVIFKMDSSFGQYSGVIIVNGRTIFGNADDLQGSGINGSYLTLLSTYNSPTQGGLAIDASNSSITGILYAPFGEINLGNNANFKEIVGWKVDLGTGTILTYDSGLISTFFSAGPSGSYSLVKGTYQIK